MSETKTTHKRRVKQNVWGNWNGYEGNRKVQEFDLNTSNKEIEAWLNGEEGWRIQGGPAKNEESQP